MAQPQFDFGFLPAQPTPFFRFPQMHFPQPQRFAPFAYTVAEPTTYPNNFIVDVYRTNLQEEMNNVSRLIDDFNYVSMDTEFPGFISRSNQMQDSSIPDQHYLYMKENVDELKVIQVGITLQNSKGEYPTGTRTWQFNFLFDSNNDESSNESIQLLTNAGINFQKIGSAGIPPEDFGEAIMASGLVLNEKTHWLTFHSGYDFGYMLKLLTCEKLPPTITGFIDKVRTFFPNVIDLKHVTSNIGQGYHGSLQAIATNLDVQRIGTMHQAGSDSLITGAVYFKLKDKHADFHDDKFNCVLFGLNDDYRDN